MYPGKQILECGTVGQQGKLLLGTPAFPHWRDWSNFLLMFHITALSVRTPVTQIGDLDGAPGFSLWPLHYLGSQSADGGSLFLLPSMCHLVFQDIRKQKLKTDIEQEVFQNEGKKKLW